MREVINAGVDPHRWFAGVMTKVIKADVNKLKDPEEVTKLKAFLLENVDDTHRQYAKAANFGFPGGMSANRFYHQCRSDGINITMQDAEDMRKAWHKAFSEMEKHMSAEPAIAVDGENFTMHYYSSNPEDDDDRDDDGVSAKSMCSTVNIAGIVRNRCTFNSALNFRSMRLK